MPAPHQAVVTIWFVTAANPARVLAAEPKADRGFGRKYLAQLNPRWPITIFGQFPLNRSAKTSRGEYYIGGYPGVTVVQTILDQAHELSNLSPRLLKSLPATDIYVFAVNEHTGLGGIAHWRAGQLKRALCARRTRVYEDFGVPEPFEEPLWGGEGHGIELPFHPHDLVKAAQQGWLGITDDGPDINVVAYAIDGRPEPRMVPPVKPQAMDLETLVTQSSTKLGFSSTDPDYDDYELPENIPPNELSRWLAIASEFRTRKTRELRKTLKAKAEDLRWRIRHIDRPK
ncbi:MAG: hypothetical protein Q4A92_05170 [Corynebacterium sp.]|nr:hypothetical protein [Corynebacterium sp.]